MSQYNRFIKYPEGYIKGNHFSVEPSNTSFHSLIRLGELTGHYSSYDKVEVNRLSDIKMYEYLKEPEENFFQTFVSVFTIPVKDLYRYVNSKIKRL
ncbi:hypothetical protein [Elizabethkingia anophelis]|nr:hypothetical protein [Elizabethkingia anophelis]